MEYLENNKIKNEVIDKLIEELENHKDTEHYVCDLVEDLLEGHNTDGTITYSTYAAKKWIQNNLEDLGEIVKKIHTDELEVPNIFDNPVEFMTIIYTEVAYEVMWQIDFMNDNWSGTCVLNDVNISIIKRQLKELKDND